MRTRSPASTPLHASANCRPQKASPSTISTWKTSCRCSQSAPFAYVPMQSITSPIGSIPPRTRTPKALMNRWANSAFGKTSSPTRRRNRLTKACANSYMERNLMTADIAGSIAVALALDEPEQLLAYLKQQAMVRADHLRPIDEYLCDKWEAVCEGLADTETKLGDVKRKPPAA